VFAAEILMSRHILAATALGISLVASGARADEYPGQDRAPGADIPPPYVSVFSWSGFYIGGNFGFAYSDTRFAYAGAPLATCAAITGLVGDCQTTGNANGNGLGGGMQAGFNQQIGHLIWGLEGDAMLLGPDQGKATFLPNFGAVQSFEETNNWLITLRPRLGFSYYRAFIYATGGVAWGSVSHTVAFADPGVFALLTEHESGTRMGWTVGTGAEYVLAEHVTLKGEYLFVDLGDTTVATSAVGGWWPTTTKFSEQEHVLRLGVNYKFW
jgi:outer membrane immunogenic protein